MYAEGGMIAGEQCHDQKQDLHWAGENRVRALCGVLPECIAIDPVWRFWVRIGGGAACTDPIQSIFS